MSSSTPLVHLPAPDPVRGLLDLVQPGLRRVEDTLAELARLDDAILGPMLGTVLPGTGKRMRPALALLIGRLGATEPEALNRMAVGVELLHTASLVHDDVVDESATRRGEATLFTRVGNALAVLVGDYLFAQAAQACVATGNLRVVQLFAETLGAMAQGQVSEANAKRSPRAWRTLTRDGYYHTIWGKTASLFVLACEGTAVLAGLDEARIRALRTYGENVGLAFQVVDDILDFTSTEDALGKPVGNDLRQGTTTLPVIVLREGSYANGRFVDVFEADDVEAKVLLVQQSGAIDAAYAEADRMVEQARGALSVLPPGTERDALDALARYVTARRV